MPDSAQSEFLYALFLTPVFEPADNLRFFLKTVEFIQLFYVILLSTGLYVRWRRGKWMDIKLIG